MKVSVVATHEYILKLTDDRLIQKALYETPANDIHLPEHHI